MKAEFMSNSRVNYIRKGWLLFDQGSSQITDSYPIINNKWENKHLIYNQRNNVGKIKQGHMELLY